MTVTRSRTEERRSIIVRCLLEQASHALTEDALQDVLGNFGHHVAADVVRDDLQWLADRSLVEIERASTWLATLTPRGVDVAEDRERVSGIKPGG